MVAPARSYCLPFSPTPITVHTLPMGDGDDPHGRSLWPAAIALAADILQHRVSLPDQGIILELGCGLGLGAVACALRGHAVLATDNNPDVFPLVHRHAAEASVSHLITTEVLDWTQHQAIATSMIIAADVWYQESAIAPFFAFAAACLPIGGVACIIDPNRPTTRKAHWIAQAAGFSVKTQTVTAPFVDELGPVLAVNAEAAGVQVTRWWCQRC